MRIAACFGSVILCVACATSSHSPATHPMVVKSIEDVTFSPAIPNLPDGPQLAVLWGDPSTGPSAMLLTLKRGALPLHTHTSDYHLVVLRGKMKHWGVGQTEADAKPLGPGSYWFQPGNIVHGDACLDEECLVHIVWSGKRDGKLASVDKR
jgi:quercetin dioxygenase-like cupin family protein